jgi:putative hydrolase of the HAD superfamily
MAEDTARLRRTLGHVDTWLFDLDNTLYPATSSLFPQIDRRMKAFIAEVLEVPPDEAYRLQKLYYHRYGTTLRGLMLEHGLEPDAFLSYVHDIDHAVLAYDRALDRALDLLPGRKLVFTNGSRRHAEKVLDRLALAHHFEDIFDIAAAGYIPKPQPETYRRLLDRLSVEAARTAFFEDSAANLKPAAAIGMTTILVRSGPDHAPRHDAGGDLSHCHHVTDDLAAWLGAVAKARAA